jgi:hypothetical protein
LRWTQQCKVSHYYYVMCFQLIIGHDHIVPTLLGGELFGVPFRIRTPSEVWCWGSLAVNASSMTFRLLCGIGAGLVALVATKAVSLLLSPPPCRRCKKVNSDGGDCALCRSCCMARYRSFMPLEWGQRTHLLFPGLLRDAIVVMMLIVHRMYPSLKHVLLENIVPYMVWNLSHCDTHILCYHIPNGSAPVCEACSGSVVHYIDVPLIVKRSGVWNTVIGACVAIARCETRELGALGVVVMSVARHCSNTAK